MIYLVLSVYILNNEEFAGLGVSVVYKNIDSPKAVLSIIIEFLVNISEVQYQAS